MLMKQEEVQKVIKEKQAVEGELRRIEEEKLKIQKDLDDTKI